MPSRHPRGRSPPHFLLHSSSLYRGNSERVRNVALIMATRTPGGRCPFIASAGTAKVQDKQGDCHELRTCRYQRISAASSRSSHSPRRQRATAPATEAIDWCGRWFKFDEEISKEFVGIRFAKAAQGESEVSWRYLSHMHFDGMGALDLLLERDGLGRDAPLPTLKEKCKPGLLAGIGAQLRFLLRKSQPSANWKSLDPSCRRRRARCGPARLSPPAPSIKTARSVWRRKRAHSAYRPTACCSAPWPAPASRFFAMARSSGACRSTCADPLSASRGAPTIARSSRSRSAPTTRPPRSTARSRAASPAASTGRPGSSAISAVLSATSACTPSTKSTT